MKAMRVCVSVSLVFLLSLLGVGLAWSQNSSDSKSVSEASNFALSVQKKSNRESPKTKIEDVPSPKKIINRFVKLVGGYEAIESIESIHVKATSGPTSRNFEFESFYKGGLLAETYTYPQEGRVFTRGVRDGVGWEGYHRKADRVYHGEELKGYLFRASRRFWCSRWIDDCKSIKFVGIEKVNDKKTYVLRMEFKNGFKFDNYFGIESGLCVRSTSQEFVRGKTIENISTVLEFERVNGILMTKKLEIVRDGTPEVYNYTELEIDCKVSDSHFDFPDGLDKEKMVELSKGAEKREALVRTLLKKRKQ